LPFAKILQVSSNIGFTKVAEKLKKERYFKYIEKFGFGQMTGIDLPGEVPGLLRKAETWSAVDLATHAFGQGISTTPMQLAMAYAAVANGGFLMKPYVVRRVLSPKGEVLAENQPHVVRRVISEKTAHMLASMLKEVTNTGGTGTMASVEGFDVAGKTARRRRPISPGSAAGSASDLVGFVPAEDPRLVAWFSSMSLRSTSTAVWWRLRSFATSRAARCAIWPSRPRSRMPCRRRLRRREFPFGPRQRKKTTARSAPVRIPFPTLSVSACGRPWRRPVR
jgi:membrane peptidoglycan carboxypeptidase